MEDLTILKNELIKKILNSSNIGFLKAINQLFSSFEIFAKAIFANKIEAKTNDFLNIFSPLFK